jgi:hypothetical protein
MSKDIAESVSISEFRLYIAENSPWYSIIHISPTGFNKPTSFHLWGKLIASVTGVGIIDRSPYRKARKGALHERLSNQASGTKSSVMPFGKP